MFFELKEIFLLNPDPCVDTGVDSVDDDGSGYDSHLLYFKF